MIACSLPISVARISTARSAPSSGNKDSMQDLVTASVSDSIAALTHLVQDSRIYRRGLLLHRSKWADTVAPLFYCHCLAIRYALCRGTGLGLRRDALSLGRQESRDLVAVGGRLPVQVPANRLYQHKHQVSGALEVLRVYARRSRSGRFGQGGLRLMLPVTNTDPSPAPAHVGSLSSDAGLPCISK